VIAGDTSSLSSFFRGDEGEDVVAIDQAFRSGALVLPPAVLTELLSDPKIPARLVAIVLAFEQLEVVDGFWRRAGAARRTITSKGLKAKLGNALIAQSCIDHNVALITRDTDFRHFAEHCGLKLA
jgi:predicted nucleic acid-binding protein